MSCPSVHPGACPICLSIHLAPQAVQTPLFHLPLFLGWEMLQGRGLSTEGAVEGDSVGPGKSLEALSSRRRLSFL